MFVLGGRTKTVEEGRELATEMIRSGRAREKFREVIRLQGGDPGIVDDPSRLPHSRHQRRLTAPRAGTSPRFNASKSA